MSTSKLEHDVVVVHLSVHACNLFRLVFFSTRYIPPSHCCRSYRRMLSTPKRSNHIKHGHPSPLTEQHRQQLTQQRPSQPPPQSPRPGELMLSPPPPHPISHNSAGGGTVHVIYHLDDIPTPYYVKWNNSVGITLRVFKEQLFARKGDYRWVYPMVDLVP